MGECFDEPATAEGVIAQLSEPGANPDGYFFAVDERHAREVGTSRARLDSMAGEPLGYVGTVGILPEYRGRGIARAMVLYTLRYLSRLGMRSAVLYVENRNMPARRLYDSMGWRPVYRTDNYWKRLIPDT